MLIRLLRTGFVALLMLAVPLQGFAAVTTAMCRVFAHHDAPAQTAPHAEHHAAADSKHDAHAGDGHAHQGAPADKDASAHCAACTACGAAAAISASGPTAMPTSPADAVDALPLMPPAGFVPAGLDRPPLLLPS